MLINPIMFVVKEGVSVLRTRFGFARTAGTSIRAATGNYLTQFIVLQASDQHFFLSGPVSQASPKTERRQKLFLSKLEYFNSTGAPDRNIKHTARLSNNSRVAVNNSINRTKHSHANNNSKQEETNRNRSVAKSFSKLSPGLSASARKTDDAQHELGSELKKPLFVTKYSSYRGVTARQAAPLIMTTGKS